ncbi:toll/interleukin-1 receptor domain-containing protein [Nocardioides sp. LML1-1-1.1]|uniref:toll/interleukin-1 receptor domain-containing protein n=1 Tax=Nocardioides sp. LML1-1-1.1 TaxID=3135248 RepID=UPI003413D6C7
MNAHQPSIRAFLSYSHADDGEFGVVAPLVQKLRAFVRAKSGRELEVFIDREAIGWGSEWRKRISSSVEGATVFIPLLSANYLDSQSCREEFLAFHSKAETLGVTELLLPILLFGSPLFDEGTTDEVAQIAESLQYKLIEEPLLNGFSSPEWLQCTRNLAESLLEAIGRAEASLLAASEVPAIDDPTSSDDSADPVSADEEAGLAEVMERIEYATDRMTAAAEKLTAAIEALGAVPERVGELRDGPTPKEINAWTLRLATEFKVPAEALETGGHELFDATKNLDETLTTLRQLGDSVTQPEISNQLNEGRRTVVTAFGDLREVAATMEEMLASMRPAEVLSVPLRKSLQPARRGITAVRDSLQLIESWQEEFAEEMRLTD